MKSRYSRYHQNPDGIEILFKFDLFPNQQWGGSRPSLGGCLSPSLEVGVAWDLSKKYKVKPLGEGGRSWLFGVITVMVSASCTCPCCLPSRELPELNDGRKPTGNWRLLNARGVETSLCGLFCFISIGLSTRNDIFGPWYLFIVGTSLLVLGKIIWHQTNMLIALFVTHKNDATATIYELYVFPLLLPLFVRRMWHKVRKR